MCEAERKRNEETSSSCGKDDSKLDTKKEEDV